MTIQNLTVSQLFALEHSEFERYCQIFEHARPKDHIKAWPLYLSDPWQAASFGDLTFGDVETIKHTFSKDLFGVFRIVFGIEQRDLMRVRVRDFFPALNWIKKELSELVKRERDFLEGSQDPDWKNAGGDRLNVFKSMNVLIAFGKEYGQTPQEVEQWKYSFVFTLLYHSRITGEVQKNYHNIMRNKK